jgi:hypothetical protein
MTDTAVPVALTFASAVERVFPTLTPAQVEPDDAFVED